MSRLESKDEFPVSRRNSATSAVRSAIRSVAREQGGTNGPGIGVPAEKQPPMTEHESGRDSEDGDMYHTRGEYQSRDFGQEDNVTRENDNDGMCCWY